MLLRFGPPNWSNSRIFSACSLKLPLLSGQNLPFFLVRKIDDFLVNRGGDTDSACVGFGPNTFFFWGEKLGPNLLCLNHRY